MTAATSRTKLIPLLLLPVLFSGCTSRTVPAGTPVAAHLKGGVHGGIQPVVGATIQFFDATLGGAPLVSNTVTTDSGGNFSLTGEYTCPAAGDQIYLVATGGDPGSGVNQSLVLMTAMGNCGDLTSSTFVNVNEVTTVATIYAYVNYFNPLASNIGGYIINADPSDYTTFLAMVDPVAGVALADGDPAEPMKLNSLANTITTCVNAATDGNGVNQPCVDLNFLAAPYYGASLPQDSAVAVFLIATNPAYDPTDVFDDAPSNPPFQPALVGVPGDWTLPITNPEAGNSSNVQHPPV